MSKLLVVDDELSIRNLCFDIFTQAGYQVSTAARGDQAFKIISIEKPDLVLLDLHIPGEEGLSLLKKLRTEFPRLPIAIFSGYVDANVEKEAFEAGAVEVITKGTPSLELKNRVDKILSAKHKIFGDEHSERKEKILVVDDDTNVRNLLVDFFSRKGFLTQGASSGNEAIQMIQKDRPTVVLLDMTMPGMDGLLTLKKIKEISPAIGVVMATAVQDEEIARQAMALGAYHYVLKPFDLQYLEMVVLTRLVIAS